MNKRSNLLKHGIVLSLLTSTLLYATNGDNLIGVGAKSRAMGGTGIAVSNGAENALSNPAMITGVEGTEISFGGTIFMPDVKTKLGTYPSYSSAADMSVIPEVSLAHKINDNWYIGVGMFGTAGMGVDYRDAAGNFNMVTNLQLMQFAVPIAYKTGGLSLAVTPILQYGNLDIDFNMPTGQSNPPTMHVGAGLAQDFGFGYNLGASYDFDNGLILGAVYKSSIKMNYDGQISHAADAFQLPIGDDLEQPAEIGVGVSYTMAEHTFAFDYKRVQWSKAKGYQDFGWEDQDVYAFGYQYAQDNWALRLGYNYAASAVVESQNPAINVLNLLGFPATSEQHYTVGGTYTISPKLGVDVAYVYSPSNTETFDVSPLPFGTVETEHSENSLSMQLTYNF